MKKKKKKKKKTATKRTIKHNDEAPLTWHHATLTLNQAQVLSGIQDDAEMGSKNPAFWLVHFSHVGDVQTSRPAWGSNSAKPTSRKTPVWTLTLKWCSTRCGKKSDNPQTRPESKNLTTHRNLQLSSGVINLTSGTWVSWQKNARMEIHYKREVKDHPLGTTRDTPKFPLVNRFFFSPLNGFNSGVFGSGGDWA